MSKSQWTLQYNSQSEKQSERFLRESSPGRWELGSVIGNWWQLRRTSADYNHLWNKQNLRKIEIFWNLSLWCDLQADVEQISCLCVWSNKWDRKVFPVLCCIVQSWRLSQLAEGVRVCSFLQRWHPLQILHGRWSQVHYEGLVWGNIYFHFSSKALLHFLWKKFVNYEFLTKHMKTFTF